MWRPFGAAVAMLALLGGLSAAPFTHAHHEIDSARDAHHPPGQNLVHAHASPHAHHGADHPVRPASEDAGEDRIWSVDGFVFQPPAPTRDHAPVILSIRVPLVPLTGVALSAPRPRPQAHGPPVAPPSGLRAPPVRLPASA